MKSCRYARAIWGSPIRAAAAIFSVAECKSYSATPQSPIPALRAPDGAKIYCPLKVGVTASIRTIMIVLWRKADRVGGDYNVDFNATRKARILRNVSITCCSDEMAPGSMACSNLSC